MLHFCNINIIIICIIISLFLHYILKYSNKESRVSYVLQYYCFPSRILISLKSEVSGYAVC